MLKVPGMLSVCETYTVLIFTCKTYITFIALLESLHSLHLVPKKKKLQIIDCSSVTVVKRLW